MDPLKFLKDISVHQKIKEYGEKINNETRNKNE